jgi:mRNA interferase YafQ
MNIVFSKYFEKRLKKLSSLANEQFYERLELFILAPQSEQLRNHPLSGTYKGYRSINITGDIRAVFKVEGELVKFEDIGTHSQLYK